MAFIRQITLAATMVLSACGSDEAAPAGGPGAGEARVIPVEIAAAELGTAARSVTATGTVEPIRRVAISSQHAGRLLQVAVEEGDAVRAGAVLARLDSRELAAQFRSAEASLQVAQRAAERAEQLREQEIITVAEYERDQAAFAAARATRDQLSTRLGYATVEAPIAGVVLRKNVEMGDVVAPQTELFVIGDVSTLVVPVPVSELDVMALDEGDTVTVELDALPGRMLQGRIRRVFPSGDPVTRLVPVEVALTGASASDARPGFLARVTFQLDPRSGVLMVPAGALVENQSGTAVFLVEGGQARRRPVQRGSTFQGRVEITEGIAAGDTVVVAGNTTLSDGAAVRIVQAPTIEPPSNTVRQGARTP